MLQAEVNTLQSEKSGMQQDLAQSTLQLRIAQDSADEQKKLLHEQMRKQQQDLETVRQADIQALESKYSDEIAVSRNNASILALRVKELEQQVQTLTEACKIQQLTASNNYISEVELWKTKYAALEKSLNEELQKIRGNLVIKQFADLNESLMKGYEKSADSIIK